MAFCTCRKRVPPTLRLSCVQGDGNCLFESVARVANCVLPTRQSATCLRHNCVQTILHTPVFRNRFADERDLSAFCENMARNATYGDELCIHALAYHLGLVIRVLSPDHDPMLFGTAGPCVHIGYNGFNHYDAIVPRLPMSAGFTPSPLLALPVSQPLSAAPCNADSFQLPPVDASAAGRLSSQVAIDPARGLPDAFCILSANITSWHSRFRVVHNHGAHLLSLQETRLNSAAVQRATAECKTLGLRSACGAPVLAQGGVAVVARSPLSPLAFPNELRQWVNAGRIVACWVPLCKGHRSLLVVSVYGISGAHPQRNPQKFQENEAFLSEP